MEVTNNYITIKCQIDGKPHESDLEIKASHLSLSVKAGSNDIIVKNLYISVDPYQINRMKIFSSSHKATNGSAALTPGKVITAYGVGKVVASGNPEFVNDGLVVGFLIWGEYSLLKGEYILRKLDPMGFPLSYHLLGRLEIWLDSIQSCAGSKEKVTFLKEKLGFDDAFNYKEQTDLKGTLKRYFPDGIDIYFDNVRAKMLEAAVANMDYLGRVAACGAIAEYTDSGKKAAPDMLDVVYKRITIRGYLAFDHMNVYEDFISTTVDHLLAGNIQAIEDVSLGLQSIPLAFVGLFHDHNIGKKIVKIADVDY
ncbi:hypothetical protein FEM48_Zijuj01G0196500 [Ziziphus jujuba var. spinosa]|uniref:2-alkenal reductase (NADP(+)-dependent)-like n=1 Tax=Ziziphus jujuba var. spinosa TaxID=714518 RepID=A0A978W364_ZIZJJ|nr:hypothetical protein FEM48_Zijuj01G0196500 [Ziziphus jujuba var. spinosa]